VATLLLALCALLVGCGSAQTPNIGKTLKPTATTAKTGSTATIGVSSPPPTLQYSFPAQWQSATGFDGGGVDNPAHHMGSVVFSPSAPSTGYACAVTTTTPQAARAPGAQLARPDSGLPTLFKTTDGGATWTTLGIPFSQSVTCQLYIDASDANDVVAVASSDQSGTTTSLSVYRTTNGGRFWSPLTLPTAQGYSLSLVTFVVTHSRLIAFMGLQGEGRLPTPLYASDDSGSSWQAIGQSVMSQNLLLEQLWTMGPSLVLASDPGCQGPCGPSQPARGRDGGAPLSQSFAGGPPSTTICFRSDDNGATWTKMNLPGGIYQYLEFMRAANGAAYYGVALSASPSSQGYTTTAYYTADSGATWTALPSFQGVENGYLDPGSIGQHGIAVAPDGSVIAGALHLTQGGGTDGGAFRIQPGSASPEWRPLVSLYGIASWQLVATSGGAQAWSMTPPSQATAGGALQFFTLP
jgi:photosystem II stability/assembly factor-like uncharacterized protein